MKTAIVHNHPIHYKDLLFRALAAQGLDFEVIFAASQSRISHEQLDLRQDSYKHRFLFDGGYEAAPGTRRLFGTLKGLREIDPDVVIVSGYYAIECWAAWAWALQRKRPIVMWYESNEFDYPRRPWWKETLKRLFIGRISRAHVYGVSNKAYLLKLGLADDRIDIKRAVVNTAKFLIEADARTYSSGRKKNILCVGRPDEQKNIGLLIRAMGAAVDAVGEPLWSLTIAGTGPLEAQLRALAIALKVDASVDFKGYVPQSQLPHLYSQADLFILPSKREAWGLVVLEAMLAGVPVAVSELCGCAYDLVNSETGWTFSPWHEKGLTDILLALPDMSPEQLATMGCACRNLAVTYSPDSCAKRVIESLRIIEGSVECGGRTVGASD